MFLPHISTSTRSSSGKDKQRHTSTENFVKELKYFQLKLLQIFKIKIN